MFSIVIHDFVIYKSFHISHKTSNMFLNTFFHNIQNLFVMINFACAQNCEHFVYNLCNIIHTNLLSRLKGYESFKNKDFFDIIQFVPMEIENQNYAINYFGSESFKRNIKVDFS